MLTATRKAAQRALGAVPGVRVTGRNLRRYDLINDHTSDDRTGAAVSETTKPRESILRTRITLESA